MATMVHIHEQTSLSDILARVRLGKDIARLTPITEKKSAPRMPGSAVGELVVPPDFDDPLPTHILDAFEQ